MAIAGVDVWPVVQMGASVVSRRTFLGSATLFSMFARTALAVRPAAGAFDPRGRIHIPIGIPDTLDTLKTFVEAEGIFSPGFGTYGVYFWVYDRQTQRLAAPTMQEVPCDHGLHPLGFLIPWSEWSAGRLRVRSEVCQVQHRLEQEEGQIVAARVRVRNTGAQDCRFVLYAALRPLGPAGFDINDMALGDRSDALVVGGRAALVAAQPPTGGGTIPEDTLGEQLMAGRVPTERHSRSPQGNCSGALWFDVKLAAGESRLFPFVCPVLPGRTAARHHWADLKQDAMADIAPLYPKSGGILQPGPNLDYYRSLNVSELFKESESYWRGLTGGLEISVPDKRWAACARAIVGHASLCMNEGAPDVAVVNYNVFNRDGTYVANIFQKAGIFSFAEAALDYFLTHPFNGRAYPEADNPGQVLWALGQQWLFARNQNWLRRVYPSAARIASMIEYYRTTPGPHWVNAVSLDFGEALPQDRRNELKPGRCDGLHPEYTEAFDIAGLRAAALLASDAGESEDARKWSALSRQLFEAYDKRFGKSLAREYGSYSVLWPCKIYPFSSSQARSQFGAIGAQNSQSWRYFPLATAHQGLLAGSREAGYGTLAIHLDHQQMRGWFAFDEGGGSASGGWYRARTTWPCNKQRPGDNLSVAMPHGWAIAELWLLLRDCIVHEDEDRLVLLAGIAPEWFRNPAGMQVQNLRTHFGTFSFDYAPGLKSAKLSLRGSTRPPAGYTLRLPEDLAGGVSIDGRKLEPRPAGVWTLPGDAREITIVFRS